MKTDEKTKKKQLPGIMELLPKPSRGGIMTAYYEDRNLPQWALCVAVVIAVGLAIAMGVRK